MKKHDKRGFTMAELLIVVAIIAVLVAVAIPVFNNQLEKSRETTDIANLRSAYAYANAALLTEEYKDSSVWQSNDTSTVGDVIYYCSFDGSAAVADNSPENTGKGREEGLSADISNLPEEIIYKGFPTVCAPNCIEMYINVSQGKVLVYFQGEYDEGLIVKADDFPDWAQNADGF